MKRISFVLLIALSSFTANAQELKLPALSPTAKLTQEFSTSNIEISYSRPSMRGRTVFGDLVPFGDVWRTGANSSTKIKFGEEVTVGGKVLKAGEYALYTIPGKEEWTVILNKGLGNWGASGYDTADDVARFKVTPKKINNSIQTFSINVTDIAYSTCNIELVWENTKVVIPVKANNEERLNTAIDKAINKPNIPYFAAANYYYETNQNLDKAMEYVNKAVDANPKAFYMWNLKARIAQKQGKKADAIAAAKQSIEVAKGTPSEKEYKLKGEAIINAVSKK
jgi:hypothetical protein